jgi:hypothetical protein
LVQDANLSPKLRRHAASRQILQRDEAIGTSERMQGGRRIAIDIVVDIGAAQSHDQRPIRIALAKIADADGAAPRVERDHQIHCRSVVTAGNVNPMAELAQDSRPAASRGSIPGP